MNKLDRMASELAKQEGRLYYARVVAELMETDAWKAIDQVLESEERANTDRLLLNDKLTEHESGLLKGAVRMLRLLRYLPRSQQKKLAEYNRTVEGLRKQLTDAQSRGVADLPDVRKNLIRLRRQMETSS